MDVAAFTGQSRVLIVVGKGGVGKTTVTAALARLAAGAGLRVLVVALDDSGGLPALFAHEGFAYEEVPLDPPADHAVGRVAPGSVHARLIRPDDALVDYLGERSLGRVSRKLVSAGVIDVVSTAIPGIREILVLGKIKQIERSGTADLILVDAPAAGHAVSLLTSAGGLFDAARGGPLRAQAVDVLEMLTDARRCQVLLVTLPEETPVNELVETAYRLEDEVAVKLSAVVVNGVYPVLEWLHADPVEAARSAGAPEPSPEDVGRLQAAASFRLARQELQAEQIERLATELPLPLLKLPYVFADAIGPPEVELLAEELANGVDQLAPRGAPMSYDPIDGTPGDNGPADATAAIGLLLDERSIVVCSGPGGVGKTTVAAALGLAAARRGRRTCVVTIDPARRLADALDIDSLSNAPARIAGPWDGELWAMMLDAKSTFNDLVRQNATDAEQAERIFRNRLYRNLTSALAGTQEYMAAEKLYELHADGRFDLVVVDTPPTRNALDFINAPKRLTRFLDNRLFRLLMVPTRASLRALSLATNTLLRTISRVAGAEIVDDAVAFFRAFAGMEDGFRDRAAQVERLLADPGTAFVVVAAPQRDPAAEAAFFARRLTDSGLSVEALIVNRSHPSFGGAPEHWLPGQLPEGEAARPWADLTRNIADFATIAQREANHVAEMAQEVAPAAVVKVPLFASDVHDLAGLELVAAHLVSSSPPSDDRPLRQGSLTSPRPNR